MPRRAPTKIEYGDFQTPGPLANDICSILAAEELKPAVIIEPTCGSGSFLAAAAQAFPDTRVLGMDINPNHLARAQNHVKLFGLKRVELKIADFFEVNWLEVLSRLPEPFLLIGNPPWVTNAVLGTLGSGNVPMKSNFQARRGIEARTGKANFDISEWMLIRLMEACHGRHAYIAMLVKATVARKVVLHAWKSGMQMGFSEIRNIDARRHFGVSVGASLLVMRFEPGAESSCCAVFASLGARDAIQTIAYHEGAVIADAQRYRRWAHLAGECPWAWRSGIKHDCSAVMEFNDSAGKLMSIGGQLVDLEPDYLYPMLKTSQIAAGRTCPTRWMLVPQRTVGESTATIVRRAPRTWAYLQSHREVLGQRKSSIYRGQPEFSVFGVGEYTFSSWKVAVSGFYKHLSFRVIGPHADKPVVLDDTSYFLACRSREEAELLAELLNSEGAQEFYRSFIFWDAKRPVTVEILRKLDLIRLAEELSVADRLSRLRAECEGALRRADSVPGGQLQLF